MAAFFLLPCFLRTPVWSRTRLLWVVLVLALGAATFVFTWCPPDGLLFRDLSPAHLLFASPVEYEPFRP